MVRWVSPHASSCCFAKRILSVDHNRISLFYVGYIISQIPANIVIAKGKPRWLLPCCMLGWSAVTICMTAMTKPWAFMLCRFLVGVTEGPFLPGVSLMTSSWYTKEESPLR